MPSFIGSSTYKNEYFIDYNYFYEIKSDDKGLQQLPTSWNIPSQYHEAFLSVLNLSFLNGVPVGMMPTDVLKKLNVETDILGFLEDAVYNARIEDVRSLMHVGLDINQKDEYGWSMLHRAVFHGHTNTVNILLELGVDKNIKNKNGFRPMHYAAECGYTEIFQSLLEAGADLSVKNDWDETPLDSAYRKLIDDQKEEDSTKKLDEGKIKNLLLIIDCLEEKNASFSQRLRVQADEVRRKYSLTRLLRDAVYNERVEDIRDLIHLGADINQKDRYGWSILHSAVFHGLANVVKILFDLGVDKNIKNDQGFTPLHYATECGHTEIFQAFLEAGADLSVKNNWNETPLDSAYRKLIDDQKEEDSTKKLDERKIKNLLLIIDWLEEKNAPFSQCLRGQADEIRRENSEEIESDQSIVNEKSSLDLATERDDRSVNTHASELCSSMSVFALVLDASTGDQMIVGDTSSSRANKVDKLPPAEKTTELGIDSQANISTELVGSAKSVGKKVRAGLTRSK